MKKITFLICSLALAAAIQAQVIHVPADYPTIQQGIDAANDGDTVLVADGTYYEQISFLGKKPLMVASHFLADGDTSHLNNTILDGSQLTDIDNASVVLFTSGEDSTSILCGFTIRGGRGSWDIDLNNRCGGGVFISGSGAKIIYNKITENTVDDTQPGNGQETYGGGIGTSHEDAEYWIVIEHNQIYNNTAVSQYGWSAGGGIYDSYNARIAWNLIAENTSTTTTTGWASGGGFSQIDLDGGGANTVIIHNNKFHHNIAQSINGVGLEGAACNVNVHLTFSGNEITANEGITPSSTAGGMGGLSIIDPAEGCLVSDNIFKENVGSRDGGAIILENYSGNPNPNLVLINNNYFLDNEATYAGAVRITNIPVIFKNNVFNGNQASVKGGAIYMEKTTNYSFAHLAVLINNSFFGNSATNSGGAIFSNKAKPLVINSIFFNDLAPAGQEIYIYHPLDTTDIAYCNIDQELIYGNVYDAGGNINEDPGYIDDTCHIDQNSPCEDFGADSLYFDGTWYFAPLMDLEGTPRPWHDGIDIGADECDIITGLTGESAVSSQQSAVNCFPNPTNGSLQFTVGSWQDEYLTLKIYDARGREVAVVLDEEMPAGEYTVQWDAENLPAGIYFYRLSTANCQLPTASGKIVKY